MLQEMMDKQLELQERLGYDFSNMTKEEITAYIKEFSIHLNQEVNEMLYELPYFKPWKDYSQLTVEEYDNAMDKARKEFIDVMHFVLNIGIALDMSATDIYDMYMDKNKENHCRQDEGYTHDKSYRDTDTTMSTKNLLKVAAAKKVLDEHNIIYFELKNGHLKVDRVNFWATTEKWYDTAIGIGGTGINSFIKYLKTIGTI